MAIPLTPAQMAAAPLQAFLPYLVGYIGGTFTVSSTWGSTATAGSLLKVGLVAGESYVLDISGNPTAPQLLLYDGAGTLVTQQPGAFVAPASGTYYLQLPAAAPGSIFIFDQQRNTDAAGFTRGGPSTGHDQLGTTGNDQLAATHDNYVLWGLDGNDIFSPGTGSGPINPGAGYSIMAGGNGTDTALFNGKFSDYFIRHDSNGAVYISDLVFGRNGASVLLDVERAQFTDAQVALDISGDGGQAYRLYQAAFNRTPDPAGLGFQMHALDAGLPLRTVAQNFIASPEFTRTYGALNDSAFVTTLYANVLHRAPDAAGLAFHVDNLAHGMARADVLVGFSESPENQANLIGVMSAGMIYT